MKNEQLTHISLFSGIGGFDLAAEWAGFRTIAMCEIDPFCQEVLAARFGAVENSECDGLPRAKESGSVSARTDAQAGEVRTKQSPRPIGGQDGAEGMAPLLIPDIRDFDGTRFRGATLLTGGFPCQPFSHAGKREGRNDKHGRHLWPEMRRVIAESRPRWVVAENVPGLISIEDGLVFEQVCTDLEGEGYEVQAFIIPACGVNAPHRRDRVWIVGHDTNPERGGRWPGGECGSVAAVHGGGAHDTMPTEEPDSDSIDPELYGIGQRMPFNDWIELLGNGEIGAIPWIEVATRFCRVDDGLPAWVHSRRVARLKALGNAIVPQCAFQIIKEIAEIEKTRVNT